MLLCLKNSKWCIKRLLILNNFDINNIKLKTFYRQLKLINLDSNFQILFSNIRKTFFLHYYNTRNTLNFEP